MSTRTSNRPLPNIETWTKEYWEAARRHELVIQRCSNCGRLRNYPRPMCPHCNSMQYEWQKMSGKGTVYSWTVVRKAFHSAFTEIPYVIAIIELDGKDKIHLVSNVIDCPLEDIRIGMPVEVVFDDVAENIALPKFRQAPNR